MGVAIIRDEHLKHVDHAALVMVGRGLQCEFEAMRDPQIERVAFNVVEFHDATQSSVQLRHRNTFANATVDALGPSPE